MRSSVRAGGPHVMQLRLRIGTVMAGLVAASITVIGARFLLAPRTAALGYGIPLATNRDRWLTAVKGARDITSGLLLASVLLSAPRAIARRVLGIATLIPLSDGGIIASRYGLRRPGLLAIHWGTAAFMLTGAA